MKHLGLKRPFFPSSPGDRKYTRAIARRIPENIKNVTAVPTAGIVTKVGRKVPIMLPTVLKAPSIPTVLPLSSLPVTVYRTREGVQVPSRKQGNTKIIIAERNAAITRRLWLMVITSSPVIRRIRYFPAKGIAAIQTAASSMRRYSRSGSGFLSALRPP